MTVNSHLSSADSVCRKTGRRFFAFLCIAALCCCGIRLVAPASAQAAEVTTLDKMQVAVGLSPESTTTTTMTFTAVVPQTVALPCTLNFIVPGGYNIIQQGEFDSDPTKPTAETKAAQVSTGDAGTTYSVTLTKSHNFFLAAEMPVSIYNYGAMGNGGVPLASFSITPATDVTALTIALAPPGQNMVGTGDDSLKSFDAGGGTTLYGQTFDNVKKGTTETVQVAFATQQQAQTGQSAADQAAQQAQASGFFAQPIVWILGALLIIVIVILVVVITRQRRSAAAPSSWDEEDEDDDDDDVKFNFDAGAGEAPDKPDEEHADPTSGF